MERQDDYADPPPHAVPYNEWPRVPTPPPETFLPKLPVSVVLCGPRTTGSLARTLAALSDQRYPRELLEVVVVATSPSSRLEVRDPGGRTPLAATLVRASGGGQAGARNVGARAATHDILVFLDGDAVAAPTLVAAHAAWHHTMADALTVGRPGRAGSDADRSDAVIADTANLTARREDLFVAVAGANFGLRRSFYERLGGCDETLADCGGEDVELGYRAFNGGGLLVPVPAAIAWLHGPRRDAADPRGAMRRARLANLIPLPEFRGTPGGRVFRVPRHVVTVRLHRDPPERAADAVDDLLAGPVGDLVVRVEMPTAQVDAVVGLRDRFAADPRVRVNPRRTALDEFPAAPLHVEMPTGLASPSAVVVRLRDALGTAAAARVAFPDGTVATIARAWALHRAARPGREARSVAAFGDVRRVPFESVVDAPSRRSEVAARDPFQNRPEPDARALAGARGLDRVLAEMRHVRGVRTGWRFARWLVAATPGRTRRRRSARREPLPAPRRRGLGMRLAAVGERANAVLQAAPEVGDGPDRHTELVVADTAAAAHGWPKATVSLADAPPALSVPAFDARRWNPVGWVRNVEPWAAALGPRGLLPTGAKAGRELDADDLHALRYCHHVVDVADFHADLIERAGVLARLAAAGIPVHLADGGPGLVPLLGAALHGIMAADIRRADIVRREVVSIRMRRIAQREHSLSSRVRQLYAAGGLPDPPALPLVSILLATRRPTFLPWALANVARQNYPRLELVVALHGDGFGDVRGLDDLPFPAKVLRVSAQATLGSVLNLATTAAAGPLLAKMDDDDLYGADHIWDLVLAHDYSGAEVVGKGHETAYLVRSDQTLRRAMDGAEGFRSRNLAGGALLVSRHGLDQAGGWRRLARGEDSALLLDVRRAGGMVYRTHAAGYLYIRHGVRPTWRADDAELLSRAQLVRAGLRPELADVAASDIPLPHLAAPDVAH